ncbi:MAG: hypothetical protein ACK5ZG_01980 [Phycisphaerae bacterium]|jgi:hypothetical protein
MKVANAMKIGLAAAMVWSAGLAPMTAMADEKAKSASKETPDESTQDTLIFRNGNVLKGTIVSETDTSIRFKSEVAGLALETEYSRELILEVKRATKKADATKDAKPATKADATKAAPAATTDKKDEAVQASPDAPRYYVVPLRGSMGGETSIRSMKLIMEDANKQRPDYIIFDLNVWARTRQGQPASQFDQNFRSWSANEALMKYLTEGARADWEGPFPKYVFAIRDAWGGAAFLPLISGDLYFFPEARMGGIGNLTYESFGGGSTRVLEKWFSSIHDQITGFAIKAGWPFPDEMVRAFLRPEFVLSLRYVDGKPQVFEGYPTDPSEELLTDAGKFAPDNNSGRSDESDSIDDLARWRGNDHLTLTAPLALKLGVSKGTVTSIDDVLSQLGIAQTGVDVGKNAKKIMEDWAEDTRRAQARIGRFWDDFQQVEVQAPGGFEERSAARGKRIRILQDLKSLLKRYEDGIPPQVLAQAQIPMGEDGKPNYREIDDIISRLQEEQRRDRR